MKTNAQEAIDRLKTNLLIEYPSLNDYELDKCFNGALGDYLRLKYPSDNNRPEPENINYTFAVTTWLYARMLDICGRAGVPKGVKRYSENNLTFEYATSTIDDELVKQIMPKAGVPK